MGPPVSRGVSRVPRYSGTRTRGPNVSRTGLSPSVEELSRSFRYVDLCNPHMSGPTTPRRIEVWAHSFSLAATGEVDVSFLSARYLDVSVPWVASDGLCIQPPVMEYDLHGVSPFGDPGIEAYLAATPGFSQPIASFIGSWHQGIHHAPLVT